MAVIEEDTAPGFARKAVPIMRQSVMASAATPTLFTLVEEGQHIEEQPLVEEVLPRKSALAEILMQFPTDLIDLVLSAPAAGAIAWHVKNYSKKKKPEGSMPPGRILQEIRRMCIDLRLTFWPGISHQGQQIACVPYGEEGWKFENSEKVMSRQELEAYLSTIWDDTLGK